MKEKELLVQCLEDFKSKYMEHSEAQETIRECESALDSYQSHVEKVRIPLMIQNARNARKANGSCLEYGVAYHLEHLNDSVCTTEEQTTTYKQQQLEKGIPGDPRFPDRDNEWIAERVKQKELLVEWLEDFKSKLGDYEEARETIAECESTLDRYKQVVEAVRIPLMIQNARNARRADGSCLEYGLEFHLKNFNAAVSILPTILPISATNSIYGN